MGSSLNPYPSHAGGGIPRPPARPYPATTFSDPAATTGTASKVTNESQDWKIACVIIWPRIADTSQPGREPLIRKKVFDEMSAVND
jgi:hypothetical protein